MTSPTPSASGEEVAGTEVRSGIAWIGRSLRPVEYSVVEGRAVVEGCIVLGSVAEIEALTEAAARDDHGLEHYGSTIRGPQYRWANKIVPYAIDPDLPEPDRVTEAIAHWDALSPLRFVERTGQNAQLYPDWITFVPAQSGCGSQVGCQGGEQLIHLAANCRRGNVIHEIGHAVGLWHEQCRNDRDVWVEIILDKVPSNVRHNFLQRIHDGDDQGQYDYGSIMHYPPSAFSSDGSDTIKAKQSGAQNMGQRRELSAGDIAAVRAIYP